MNKYSASTQCMFILLIMSLCLSAHGIHNAGQCMPDKRAIIVIFREWSLLLAYYTMVKKNIM